MVNSDSESSSTRSFDPNPKSPLPLEIENLNLSSKNSSTDFEKGDSSSSPESEIPSKKRKKNEDYLQITQTEKRKFKYSLNTRCDKASLYDSEEDEDMEYLIWYEKYYEEYTKESNQILLNLNAEDEYIEVAREKLEVLESNKKKPAKMNVTEFITAQDNIREMIYFFLSKLNDNFLDCTSGLIKDIKPNFKDYKSYINALRKCQEILDDCFGLTLYGVVGIETTLDMTASLKRFMVVGNLSEELKYVLDSMDRRWTTEQTIRVGFMEQQDNQWKSEIEKLEVGKKGFLYAILAGLFLELKMNTGFTEQEIWDKIVTHLKLEQLLELADPFYLRKFLKREFLSNGYLRGNFTKAEYDPNSELSFPDGKEGKYFWGPRAAKEVSKIHIIRCVLTAMRFQGRINMTIVNFAKHLKWIQEESTCEKNPTLLSFEDHKLLYYLCHSQRLTYDPTFFLRPEFFRGKDGKTRRRRQSRIKELDPSNVGQLREFIRSIRETNPDLKIVRNVKKMSNIFWGIVKKENYGNERLEFAANYHRVLTMIEEEKKVAEVHEEDLGTHSLFKQINVSLGFEQLEEDFMSRLVPDVEIHEGNESLQFENVEDQSEVEEIPSFPLPPDDDDLLVVYDTRDDESEKSYVEETENEIQISENMETEEEEEQDSDFENDENDKIEEENKSGKISADIGNYNTDDYYYDEFFKKSQEREINDEENPDIVANPDLNQEENGHCSDNPSNEENAYFQESEIPEPTNFEDVIELTSESASSWGIQDEDEQLLQIQLLEYYNGEMGNGALGNNFQDLLITSLNKQCREEEEDEAAQDPMLAREDLDQSPLVSFIDIQDSQLQTEENLAFKDSLASQGVTMESIEMEPIEEIYAQASRSELQEQTNEISLKSPLLKDRASEVKGEKSVPISHVDDGEIPGPSWKTYVSPRSCNKKANYFVDSPPKPNFRQDYDSDDS